MNYDVLTIDYIEQLKDIDNKWFFTCDADNQRCLVDSGDDE